MSRIDAHHHLWDTTGRDYPWMDGPWADPLRGVFGADDLASAAEPHDVEATVVVQALADLGETRELLAVARTSPLVAGVVGWVDLTEPAVSETLAGLREGPGGEHLVGVRHQVQDEPDPAWLDRADVRRGLRAVGAAGLVYDLLVMPPQLPAAIRAVRDLPDVRFVLDHLAKPAIAERGWEPWASSLAELAGASPTVTAKLSGLVTEADWRTWSIEDLHPYVDHALDCFGPERLMFGSDWPVCLLAADYGTVVAAADALLADLAREERQAVLGDTARRTYRLTSAGPPRAPRGSGSPPAPSPP